MSVRRPEMVIKEGEGENTSPFIVCIDGEPKYYFQDEEKASAFMDGYLLCWDDHFGRD